MRKEKLTFAVIVGTRGFFSAELARSGRRQLLEQIERAGHRAVILPAEATPTGAVETVADARKCADLWNEHRNEIDGVIVCLPNFGDELGIVNALHLAKLGVPVLVQACDDELDKLTTAKRRDSFCGKISVCANLRQYGILFTDTATHTVALTARPSRKTSLGSPPSAGWSTACARRASVRLELVPPRFRPCG
jgi:L-fucose isomerase-like protein